MMKKRALITAVVCTLLASPAVALDPSWPELRETLYGDKFLTPAGDVITIDAPYRSQMDARTQIGATVTAPQGRMLESITVILDENPMPVSAVFTFDEPVPHFFFDVTMRVNGPTPLHVVARTTEGQLFVADSFVKTSGQGACAAPPGTDPELALATLGNMQINVTEFDAPGTLLEAAMPSTGTATHDQGKRMDLDLQHPSHSGMQMDQITLLYLPARFVDNIAVDLDGAGFVDVTGSISFSEDPQISLSVPSHTRSVDVTMTDTDGFIATAHKTLPGF
ncbi:quinoprotein dehydrogenase-associated SoxYZ-like carrier [Yoonia sediminilitoris]|uniref:Sulfur-oxidizing protein SoxY n=1 Tax=Yoonia sediminilitoris TaxID=1286148 RepID=A0A2T6KSB0_9RHOB|nr:quinoprotein dehydrogenase-associated SoxYZ-like carrier [Yoonia sediminilitoris]PUB19415.1 sulfur-oxidizing protein SoxY [Yoonia sediminilitoris]RCW99583.1 sulfur-oxidizing protein SoxY [Yoonia sediminilitoris]